MMRRIIMIRILKNFLLIATILLLAACENGSTGKNSHEIEQLQKHYENGESLYIKGEYDSSIKEFCTAEELAIKLRDNKYYGLIQHQWLKFPDKTRLDEKKKEELRFLTKKYEYIALDMQKGLYITVFATTIIVSLVVYFFLRSKEQEKSNIKKSNDQLRALQEKLQENKEYATKEIDDIKRRLFKERFYTIDKLCNELYQSSARDENKEIRSINRIINNFKDDKGIAQLEDTINLYKNNILSKLREQIPTLNEQEIIFATYAFAGLSNNTISYLIDKPVDAIYSKRSKLKRKIKASGAKNADWFIEELK